MYETRHIPGNMREMTDDATLIVVGKELRAAREAADLSQEILADTLDKGGRDWTSKLERGLINISLCDYLQVVDFLRETMPADHPALPLVTHFKRRRPRA